MSNLGKKTFGLVGRYIFSGCIGAAVNIGGLYVLTDILGLYYLFGSLISFITSLIVSFLLQKKFTFQNLESDPRKVTIQFSVFATLGIVNTIINEVLLFLFVQGLHIHHILAAIISSGLIALLSFFVYKNYIFARPVVDNPTT